MGLPSSRKANRAMFDPIYIDEDVAEEMGADCPHLSLAENPFAYGSTLYWRWAEGRAKAIAFSLALEYKNETLGFKEHTSGPKRLPYRSH